MQKLKIITTPQHQLKFMGIFDFSFTCFIQCLICVRIVLCVYCRSKLIKYRWVLFFCFIHAKLFNKGSKKGGLMERQISGQTSKCKINKRTNEESEIFPYSVVQCAAHHLQWE